jgi:hypothetical protein
VTRFLHTLKNLDPKGIQQVAIKGLEDYLKVSMFEGSIKSFIMQKHSTNCHLKGLEDQKVSMFDALNSS